MHRRVESMGFGHGSTRSGTDARLGQIASVANAEPIGSALYFVHAGLIALGGLIGALLFQHWGLAAIAMVYVACLTLEKRSAARAVEEGAASRYPLILTLLCARAVAFNVLVITVWSVDSEVFKLAAMALLVAATINIFVFHATYPAVIACVVGPVWLGFAVMGALVYAEFGLSREAFAAAMIFLFATPYFYMALMNARAQWARIDVIQQALTQSQKQDALGKLVAGVAHDFNNILAVTLGNAELLKDADPGDVRELSEEIVKAAARGASLSSQLLAFGRRTRLEPSRHRVQDILQDLQRMLDRVLPEAITISTTIQPGTPAIFVDRLQLETALLNLAINARDAMPEGGRLEILTDAMEVADGNIFAMNDVLEPGLYARIRVIDTGSGVPKAIQSEVFDPFFTTKPVGEGSGLGLSMVLGFANQSGGAVQLQSDGKTGTTVSLILPGAVRAEQPSEARSTVHDASGKAHILVVEDDEAVRRVLERHLLSAGYWATVAIHGQDAAAMLQSGLRPDLLISDLVMPGPMQGLELARFARSMIPDLPVLFLSGYPQGAGGDVEAWSGSAGVLQKPIRRADLLEALQETLA